MGERTTAKRMVTLGRRHIADQRERIERQRALIDRLEREDRGEVILRNARQHLGEMLKTLEGMLVALREAVERAEHPAEKGNAAPLDEVRPSAKKSPGRTARALR